MDVTRKRARVYGVLAILGVALVQAFNSFACYKHDALTYLGSLLYIGIPMLPAVLSLATKNPLRTIGAAILFVPWLVLAYYTDCVRQYSGGGASMIYVAVFLWGSVSALIGALITGPILKRLRVSVI